MRRAFLWTVVFISVAFCAAQASIFEIPGINSTIDLPENWAVITRETKVTSVPESLRTLVKELESQPSVIGYIYYYLPFKLDVLVAQLAHFTDQKMGKQTGISREDSKEVVALMAQSERDSKAFDGNTKEKFIEGKDLNFVKISGTISGDPAAFYLTLINGYGFSAAVRYHGENTLLAFENLLTNMDVKDYEKGQDNSSFSKTSFWDRFVNSFLRELSWRGVSLLIFAAFGVVFLVVKSIKTAFRRK